MDFSARCNLIGNWLQGALRRYTPPAGMDNETLRKEMSSIVQDINSFMPTSYNEEQIQSYCERIEKYIRQTQRSRHWPTIPAFIEAAKVSVLAKDVTDEDITFDTYEINAQRIRNGDQVSEYFLYGREAVALMHLTSISEEMLKPYRDAAYEIRLRLYDYEAAEAWLAERELAHALAVKAMEKPTHAN